MQQMKASLCLRAQHLPAKRHHKNVMMHSSVRLPPIQTNNGSPPGAARVAVVGAGVVLACALGAMYWKRARALQFPMYRSSPTSHSGESGDTLTSALLIQKLPGLLSEICIRTSDPMPPQLTELIDQCLTKEDKENIRKGQDVTRVLQSKLPITLEKAEHYDLGLALTLALINAKEYDKAEKICKELQDIASFSRFDSRPNFLMAIINIMMIMESMVRSPTTTSTSELKTKLQIVEEEWGIYESKLGGGPPQIPPQPHIP
ncbi:hypothetical protein LUZ61_005894 [Rhynchospora tenuis]|uniref:Uncharacterized protein n=1 Tax=Rhynchospora tenuis TaxID=198213 RepID=A0AAD6EV52_9POAL|nr:hypothetical protein LUZ61_005894 [Rhynchospora tenuis]